MSDLRGLIIEALESVPYNKIIGDVIDGFKMAGIQEAIVILVDLTSDQNSVLSSKALYALLALDHKVALDILETQLEHYDSRVRWGACHVLARHGTERSVPHVINVFLNDPDADVRHVAAYTLGCLGSRRAIPALRHGVLHDSGTEHEGHPVAEIAEEALRHLEEG